MLKTPGKIRELQRKLYRKAKQEKEYRPVFSGAKIRDHIVLTALEERPDNRILMTLTHTIEIEGQKNPACFAQALAMVFF